MRRTLLCLDLDGTLLSDGGALGEETARTIEALRGRGHVVSFVTGRGEIDMLRCRYLYRHADYMLLNSGGKLLDTADGAQLFNERIPPGPARALAEHCLREGLQLYAMMGLRYAVTKMTPGVEAYAGEVGVRPGLLRSPDELPPHGVESFMSGGDGERVARYIRAEGLPLHCAASEPGCCDITPRHVEKWSGVRRLAARLEIPERDVLAVGNYDNDIGMLRGAGTGVAVANALEQVKAAADYVTGRSNNEDALAEIGAVFFGL